MNTAIQYYYANVATEEKYQSYQKLHQEYLYSDDDPIITHIPVRSNCKLIEQYITEIIDLTPSSISKRLNKLFVAKQCNFYANAGAMHDLDTYEGDLVFFRVGLSDLLFQFAILFTQFTRLSSLGTEYGEKHPIYMDAFVKLCMDIETLTEAQLDWAMNKNAIQFGENYLEPSDEIVGKAATIATFMDKSILRHEIGHHLLGHTKSNCVENFELVDEYLKDMVCSAEHLKELQADLTGIYLPITNSGSISDIQQITVEVVLGTLLAQTALAQMKPNILFESESHPSWYTRFTTSLNFIEKVYSSNIKNGIIDDVSRFQALLYVVQDKGLGALQKDLLKSFEQV